MLENSESILGPFKKSHIYWCHPYWEDLGNIDQKWHCEDSDSDDDNADLYQCLCDVSYDSDLA
jgi:hypothetical protein